MPKLSTAASLRSQIYPTARALSSSHPAQRNLKLLQPPPADVFERIIQEAVKETLSKEDLERIRKIVLLPTEDLIRPKYRSRKNRTPRPQNAFVIFRRDYHARAKRERGERHAANLSRISKEASLVWRAAEEELKKPYEDLADLAKLVHQRVYPGYVYQPCKRRSRSSQIPNQDFAENLTFHPQSPEATNELVSFCGYKVAQNVSKRSCRLALVNERSNNVVNCQNYDGNPRYDQSIYQGTREREIYVTQYRDPPVSYSYYDQHDRKPTLMSAQHHHSYDRATTQHPLTLIPTLAAAAISTCSPPLELHTAYDRSICNRFGAP